MPQKASGYGHDLQGLGDSDLQHLWWHEELPAAPQPPEELWAQVRTDLGSLLKVAVMVGAVTALTAWSSKPFPRGILQLICPAAAPSLMYYLKSTLLMLQCRAASSGGVKANGSPVHRPLLEGVLVLAGIELIFFRVAGVGLRFGFVLETVLVIQGCFSYC